MRVTYDPSADAAYVCLVDTVRCGEVAWTEPCDLDVEGAAVILGFDSAGKLIGIEILGARKLLAQEVLDAALSPEKKE